MGRCHIPCLFLFQFLLVRLKAHGKHTVNRYYKISIPSGTIKSGGNGSEISEVHEFQFLLVRLKAYVACNLPSVISIPSGTIKVWLCWRCCNQGDISIPSGTIKSRMLPILKSKYRISIPSGTIKRSRLLYTGIVYFTLFQFLLVRLKVPTSRFIKT